MITPTWQRGDVSLYLGDAREILPHLPKVDAVVTDPPYGIVNKFGRCDSPDGTRTMQFAWDSPDGVAAGVAQAQAGFVFCGFDTVYLVQEEFRQAGLTPKPFCWVKQCPPPPKPGNWWPSGFEIAVYGYRTGAWFGDDDPSRRNVWYGDTLRGGNTEKVDHPTQKPMLLMEHVIASIVPDDRSVCDMFMGSGTTGVAAVKLGRKFIGIEIEPKYFDIAVRRISEAQDQFALFDPVPPAVTPAGLFEAIA